MTPRGNRVHTEIVPTVVPSAHVPPSKQEPYMCLSQEVEALGRGEVKYSAETKCLPLVITIFSAPNYCDSYENKGAILTLGRSLGEFQFAQYDCVEHPAPDDIDSEMNNQIAAVVANCPYMPSSFQDFVRLALELGFEEDLFEEEEDRTIHDDRIGDRCGNIVVHTRDGVEHAVSLSNCPITAQDVIAQSSDVSPFIQSSNASSSAPCISVDYNSSNGTFGSNVSSSSLVAGEIEAKLPEVAAKSEPLHTNYPFSSSPLYKGKRHSESSPLLKSQSLFTEYAHDYSLKGVSPQLMPAQKPPLFKNSSENHVVSPPPHRRSSISSMASPAGERKSMGADGYIRQRKGSQYRSSLSIEVVDSPAQSETISRVTSTPADQMKAFDRLLNQRVDSWRERRGSAPTPGTRGRRASVTLTSGSALSRGATMLSPNFRRPDKLDSDDDTIVTASTSNTLTPPTSAIKFPIVSGQRTSLGGSEISELSPVYSPSPQVPPRPENLLTPPYIMPKHDLLSPIIPLTGLNESKEETPSKKRPLWGKVLSLIRGQSSGKTGDASAESPIGTDEKSFIKRQSFAVAHAFDAINERHPDVTKGALDVCQLKYHTLLILDSKFIS